MKKAIWSLWFCDEEQRYVEEHAPLLVYRYCSMVPVHKIKRLAKQLKCDLTTLFSAVFSQILFNRLKKQNITLFGTLNEENNFQSKSQVDAEFFVNTVRQSQVIENINDKLNKIFSYSSYFEVKLVKNLMILSFYYPDGFSSDTFSHNILFEVDALLKKQLKSSVNRS